MHVGALCSAVRGIFVRTILNWLSERAAAAGAPDGSSGAVVLAQRFGGALNLNLHFHALVLDGVYTSQGLLAAPRFQPARELTDQDVVHVTGLLVRRIVRYLQRRGRLPREQHAEHDEPVPDDSLLALLSAASVRSRHNLLARYASCTGSAQCSRRVGDDDREPRAPRLSAIRRVFERARQRFLHQIVGFRCIAGETPRERSDPDGFV